VMECNSSYSMKIFHELCESQFYEEIGRKILGSEGMKIRRIYMMLVQENMGV
jgi:hypothetical protein